MARVFFRRERFAQKVTTFAPLTRAARAFSPHKFTRPDFRLGAVVTANFTSPKSHAIEGIRESYTENSTQGLSGQEAD